MKKPLKITKKMLGKSKGLVATVRDVCVMPGKREIVAARGPRMLAVENLGAHPVYVALRADRGIVDKEPKR